MNNKKSRRSVSYTAKRAGLEINKTWLYSVQGMGIWEGGGGGSGLVFQENEQYVDR